MDGLIAGVVGLVVLGFSPVAQYWRNYSRAGEQIATQKARELEIDADKARRERDEAQAKLDDRANKRLEELRRAFLPMLNELERAHDEIQTAQAGGQYSNDMVAGLPADAWREHQGVLAANQGLHDTYDMTYAAYNRIDKLNKRVAYRHTEGLTHWMGYGPTDSPHTEASDDLPGVLEAIDEALVRLKGAVRHL